MKNKNKIIVSLLLGLSLIVLTAYITYKEWAPSDNTAASTYYVSPSGLDTNNGTNASPWKTLTKAQTSIAPGDTVILKDGSYPGYFVITKPNTTWRGENKHGAVVDGGFAPSMLEGDWRKIKIVWDRECEGNGKGKYSNLININADSVTIDGLYLRNSCGRGVLASDGSDDSHILNTRIDWTMSAGAYISADSHNLQFIGNEMTRISFGDAYQYMESGNYAVNISIHMSGENMVVRDNIIAWGRGEIAMTGARNLLFEDNLIIGNKNNFYPGWASGVIVRNNLFWSPESQLNPGTHWEKLNGNVNNWHLSSRNEMDGRWASYVTGLDDIAYYNNIILNNSISFDGYHRKDMDGDGEKDFAFSSDTTKVYFGHNTVIAGTEDENVLGLTFSKPDIAPQDSKISGIVENNIFDISKNTDAGFNVSFSSNDRLTFRNNILPTNANAGVRGEGDIYTNDTGLNNPLYRLDFPIPGIGVSNLDMNALRSAVELNNYRLKQNSQAVNASGNLGSINETEIPPLAKSQDYFKNTRTGIADIGAIEYGGVYYTSTPTPIQSATPSPTNIPGSTSTPTPIPTTTPTLITGSVCGRADSDSNGAFDIADFVTFAAAYQDGNRTCDDTAVNYGVCGGRDVDRDGRLNIADFGGTNGFASRYYPKTSCAL